MSASQGQEKTPSELRTKTVASNVTPEQKKRIDLTAKMEGKSTSEWLRDLADEHADPLPEQYR